MAAYISEISYGGNFNVDFVEIRVPAGTDVSAYSVTTYTYTGSVEATFSFGAPTASMSGSDIYVFDSATAGFTNINMNDAVALVDDTGSVLQFVSFAGSTVTASGGPADGATSTEIGTATGSKSLQSDDGGSSYYTQSSPNKGTVPCYAAGTLIDTPNGQRSVETLKIGDLVQTLDHGPQPIRWIRSGEHPLQDAEADAKPVLIKAGALGPERPSHDLIVSPQHRILVGGARQLTQISFEEAFAPAKSLTSLRGIRHMNGKSQITWVHFAFDRHEIVTANGCLSESLLLGPMVLNGLTSTERQALNDIFGAAPASDAALNGPAARECLKVGAVRRKLQESSTDNSNRLPKEIQKWDLDIAMERHEADRLRQSRTTVQGRGGAPRVA